MTHNLHLREAACGPWQGRGVPSCCLDLRLVDPSEMTKRATASAEDDAATESEAQEDPHDDTVDDSPKTRRRRPRPSATAAIVGAVFDAATSPAVRSRLKKRKSAIAVVVHVPTAAWVAPVSSFFLDAFGEHWKRHTRDGTNKTGHRATLGSDEVAVDLAYGRCTVGVAADPKVLPAALVSAADIIIPLSVPRGVVVAEAIRRFTGRRPRERIEDDIVAGLDLNDIIAAFRAGSSSKRIVARLAAASAAVRGAAAGDRVPDLARALEYGEARAWGLDLARDIADYRAGRIPWSDVSRGAVLHSQSGMGKSLFARALARACGVPLISSSVADWLATGRGYLNDVIAAARAVFAQAHALAPSIMFLDEVDALPNRETLDARNRDYWTPLVNDVLVQLDDAVGGKREGVVVIGATNDITAIDPALLRPGRLERAIEIKRPDLEGTINILRFHLHSALEGADLTEIGSLLEGATPAEIMQVVRDARRLARRGGRTLSMDDMRSAALPPEDIATEKMWRMCVHEAAHAVAALAIPSGSVRSCVVRAAGGQTIVRRDNKDLWTRKSAEDRATAGLCGRAAERILIGSASIGSGGDDDSDLAIATRLVASLHASMGLGDTIAYVAPETEVLKSIRTDRDLRARVEKDLRALQGRADDLVGRHRDAIVAVAEALRERRHLSGDSIRTIFEGVARDAAAGRDVRRV